MLLASLYSLTAFGILLGAQMMRPLWFSKLARYAFWISVFFIFFIASYLTYQQYQIWRESAFSRFLLPPHQPFSYFLEYALTHFWTGPMIAFAMALIGFSGAAFLNRKFEERFFWPAEPWLFAIGIFLTGHPGWIFYTAALLAAGIVVSIFKIRFSFYWFWIPAAIGVIIYLLWFKFPLSS